MSRTAIGERAHERAEDEERTPDRSQRRPGRGRRTLGGGLDRHRVSVACRSPGDSVRPMNLRVVVWGTGNVGRPALRAIAAHRDLELAGVIVANPDKVGRDAGELAGIEPLGVAATDDVDAVLAGGRRRGGLHRDRRHPARRRARRTSSRASAAARTSCRRPSTRCCTRASAPPELLEVVGAACAEGELVGVRVRDRSRAGRSTSFPRS